MLFGLRLNLFTISVQPLRIVLLFLSFKVLSQECLVKTTITHNRNLILWFLEDNGPISAKCDSQILSLSLHTLFPFSFLITGLCSSWTTSSFTLAPDPDHTC